MKTLIVLSMLLGACSAAAAQVAPQGLSPSKLSIGGDLSYAVRYSQMAAFYGSSQGSSQQAILSGDLAYTNGDQRAPFSATLGAGYTWNLAGADNWSGPYENFILSQGLVARGWSITASDNVSYFKLTPTTGFSGVPGTGEPIGQPNPVSSTNQSILTIGTTSISNSAMGSFIRQINKTWSLTGGGGQQLLRYPDGNGYDTTGNMANAGLTERLSARNSFMEQYEFSSFTFSGYNFSFVSNTAMFGWTRQWSRHINSQVSAGPDWIGSSNSAAIPASTQMSAQASLTETLRSGNVSLQYSRGSSGGSGYYYGSETDEASAGLSRQFGKNWTAEMAIGYYRTVALAAQGSINSKFASAQATRKIGQRFSAYADYTASTQSTSSQLPANVQTQLWQMISFGFGYTPPALHLRR